MADYRTEEEQIELLKRWWDENGKSTLAGVAIALGLWFAWTTWQDHRQSRAEAAAALYQQLVPASEESAKSLPADQVNAVAGELRAQYADSVYAVLAALHQARVAVEQGDLAKANEALQWAHAQKMEASLAALTGLRLAAVQFAQAQYDAAQATLAAGKELGAYSAAYAELRGDVALAQGRTADAREAYQSALRALDEFESREQRQSVEMKLADLAQAVSAAPTAPATQGKSS